MEIILRDAVGFHSSLLLVLYMKLLPYFWRPSYKFFYAEKWGPLYSKSSLKVVGGLLETATVRKFTYKENNFIDGLLMYIIHTVGTAGEQPARESERKCSLPPFCCLCSSRST